MAPETFDDMSVIYQMPDYDICWNSVAGIQNGPWGRAYGLAFLGNDATLVIDRESWELYPETKDGNYKVPAMPKQNGHESHDAHLKNWIDYLRTRKEPVCPVETGRLAAVYAHLGNNALRANTRLVWNDAIGRFEGNNISDSLIMPGYREPWSLPKFT